MSETSQGPGWWQASDKKWYPPEAHPDHQPSSETPAPAHTSATGASSRGRPWPWVIVAAVAVGVVTVAIGVVVVVTGSESAVTDATVTVEREPELSPEEAFVGSVGEAVDGAVVYGTSDDEAAAASEVWAADAVSAGLTGGTMLGPIEVDGGVPYIYGMGPDGTGEGFYAAGEIYFPATGDTRPALYGSPDGVDWSILAEPAQFPASGSAFDIASAGDTSLAIIDDFGDERGSELWVSDDVALTWRRVDAVELEAVEVFGLTTDDDGFVVVGSRADGEAFTPVVARSSDGSTWEVLELGQFADLNAELFDVTRVPGGYLAVGVIHALTSDDALFAVSDDLSTWTVVGSDDVRTPDNAESSFTVAATENGAVATGVIDGRYGFWTITID